MYSVTFAKFVIIDPRYRFAISVMCNSYYVGLHKSAHSLCLPVASAWPPKITKFITVLVDVGLLGLICLWVCRP